MKIVLNSSSTYKSFRLSEPVEFEGFLSVITGKNGSGKTRLLESIKHNNTVISIDGETLPSERVSIIDINNQSQTILRPYVKSSQSSLLAEGVFDLIKDYDTSENLPAAAPIRIYPDRKTEYTENFNLKKIIQHAETLYQKKMSELDYLELEISTLIFKEIINSRITPSQASMSELTVIHYQALEKYDYLKFKCQTNINLSEPKKEIIDRYLAEEPPCETFNKIIAKLFRGKYYIAPPNERYKDREYTPKLTLTHNDETISPEDLSSGEKTIFWLAEKTFYTTKYNFDITLSGKSVILIDEPDAHLHPQMAHDLYECLNSLHLILDAVFIITTHSPTTIALCPSENIFNMIHDTIHDRFKLSISNKDGAISQLLEGISQISVNPDNSRQVYVENTNDSNVYERYYATIKNRSSLIDPNISLSFISAGPKIADSELIKHIECVYGKNENTHILLEKINGDSNCQQVIGMVEHLSSRGNKTVRGLIDWDSQTRKHDDNIVVFAKNYAYSIENVVYDPLSIFAFLMSNDFKKPCDFLNVDADFFWKDALEDYDKAQTIIDVITKITLGRSSNKDHPIDYMGGLSFKGDREYFIPSNGENGHDFETKVLKAFPDINKIGKTSTKRPLIYHFATKATLGCLGWRFVNSIIEKTISDLQK